MTEAFREQKDIVLGVDIGGTHITAALVDLCKGRIVPGSRRRASIDSGGSAGEIISSCAALMQDCLADHAEDGLAVGIAIPGPFDYEKGVSLMQNQAKFDSLYQLNVKEALAGQLGLPSSNIRFINDAASFLKGEVFAGAAKGSSCALGITLGTGLGSSFFKDERVQDADLWHSAFKDGIAEDYLCSRWFVQRYYELSGKRVSGVKALKRLGAEDEAVRRVFQEFAENFVAFLSRLPQLKQAERLVLGGNISNANQLFLGQVIDSLKKNGIFVPVEVSLLQEDASLLGAASCWARREVSA